MQDKQLAPSPCSLSNGPWRTKSADVSLAFPPSVEEQNRQIHLCKETMLRPSFRLWWEGLDFALKIDSGDPTILQRRKAIKEEVPIDFFDNDVFPIYMPWRWCVVMPVVQYLERDDKLEGPFWARYIHGWIEIPQYVEHSMIFTSSLA